ncbi:OsmC family peroxiredoxin [Salibacterium salarium]|uniref:OsmC family peroxiredoxin n=1 Tax=Salibacterium salarium TaxID=284579 RepID=A0A3R9PIS9_9BACI|nr:OsmC family protein [Salibacterium salarium]RSL31642.1 OsmC family peroxiredoxin [Salibacterium salarium]
MEFFMQEQGFSTETGYGTLQSCGDEDYGFRPYQLLISSIAVCSGGVLRKIMDKRRQTVHDINITADVTRSEEGANEVQKIHLHFIVEADNITETKMEKNMELTRKHCAMVQSVKDSIEVTETFELKG